MSRMDPMPATSQDVTVIIRRRLLGQTVKGDWARKDLASPRTNRLGD